MLSCQDNRMLNAGFLTARFTFHRLRNLKAHAPGIVRVAAEPGPVGHPEVCDHVRLVRIVLLEELPAQHALFDERAAVIELCGKAFLLYAKILHGAFDPDAGALEGENMSAQSSDQ